MVQAALEEASKNRTTLIVSHRQSTIADADIVAVMKDGMIVRHGPREEILESPSWGGISTPSAEPNSSSVDGAAKGTELVLRT